MVCCLHIRATILRGPQAKTTNSREQFRHGEVSFLASSQAFFLADYCEPDINLTKLVPELDTTASDIVTHQRDALVSRKDLAQKTKDFRKLDDAAKLAEFKTLLKCELQIPPFPLIITDLFLSLSDLH